MGSEGGHRENMQQSSRFVATWLVGGVVLGLSVLGLRFALPKKKKRPIRVYMDGCFDMMHYGHCNALRQARALGDQLVVGVVSDAEIIANKGPPVTPLHERMIMVGAVKWVDEVISDAPYAITEEFMRKLFDEYNIDYIIHGDDPCLLPDGTDAYALAKKVGRYKQIKRTEGVSSTDIVGRMLLCVRERTSVDSPSHASLQRQFSHGHSQKSEDGVAGSGTRVSHFLPTSRRIVQFSNSKGAGPGARIVYIDGAFDLFHAGHVEILRLARGLGDFLLVGIHTDQTALHCPALAWRMMLEKGSGSEVRFLISEELMQVGLPIQLWCFNLFKKIGDQCGEFIDAETGCFQTNEDGSSKGNVRTSMDTKSDAPHKLGSSKSTIDGRIKGQRDSIQNYTVASRSISNSRTLDVMINQRERARFVSKTSGDGRKEKVLGLGRIL
ncbi:Ethanolamine-phosphate cytidylyltransferase [Datura stramonium]|uniref:ethanolamine-phosphate cytidylyltransferase n=1 Tax=Datura stramonium TaxID=4076 RepID=A0ABS8VAF1_DATST|nr:Ethanolamine-phosphate cytidylyltransferase [Datura stramonium]